VRPVPRKYARATQNLAKHLEQLVTESASDPIFFERPKLDDLAFAGELMEYVERHVTPKIQKQQRRSNAQRSTQRTPKPSLRA